MQVKNRMVEDMLIEFGLSLRAWRKLQSISASEAASRAGIHRQTLRDIETGTGTPKLENVFAVLNVLGIMHEVVKHSSPEETEQGLALLYLKACRKSK